MKRKRRYCRQILSVILCIAMILGNCPICAEAKESQMQPIQAVQMDGMAEPTEFPAKGTIHTYVLRTESMEHYEESFEEVYLSVLVDQEHQVYASLNDLKDFLDLQVKVGTVLENGKARRTVRWHNTMLVMYEGNPEALYVKSLKKGYNDYYRDNLNVYFSLGNAPIIKDDEFYVPMDAFLQCTGSFAFYSGENEDGKQDLYLVPPQRTVLDDILGYADDLYSIYAFSMEKDFGMTEDGVRNTYYSAEAVQFLKRFGSLFDGAAWSESVIGDRFFDDKYVDLYMDYLLHMNEEVLDETLQKASSVVDAAAIALDVTELSVSDQWTNPTVVTKWILNHANQKHLDRVRDMCDYAGSGTFILGNVLNYASISSSLYGADQISADGAKRLMEKYVDTQEYDADAEQNWKRVKKNIDKTGEKLGLQAFGTWLETYWMSNGMSFARILTENFNGINGTLGVVGLASTIWSGGTSLLYGKFYDQTESMMAAYFGEQYEKEALAAVADVIVRYLNGSASEEETRAILYHSMAACYTTRYFGCQAMADHLAYYPKQAARQQEINQLLVKLMAIVQNDSIPMGMRADDVANLTYQEEIHYPNVTFKLCQVQGTITYCDSGKPAGKLEVWISDETGEKLAEFITEESGAFDVSFEIETVNVLDSGERMKQITFHVEEWWYPEILETVEIPVFKKSRIDGLWAGEQKETIQCYLEDAKEENGQLILDIRKIEIKENKDKIFNLEIPTFITDSSYDSYLLREGQYEIADSIERVVLKDGMEIKTMYALLYPDGTFVGEMFQLFSSSVLNSADVDRDVLLNSDMKTAEEIYQYVELYRTVNGNYPAYEMEKVNSEIQSLEPILVELY